MVFSGIAGTAIFKEVNFSMTQDVMEWLKSVRKLDGELLTEMQVRATDHPSLGQVAMFPYLVGGEFKAAKFRTIDKKFLSTKGVSRGLYNADALSRDQDKPVVITEGEIDCLSVIQAGHIRAVSLPDGWTEQGNKTEDLAAAEELLRASPWVIVAGDNDKAGESLPRAVANILAGHDVRYATWPEGCKDPNDVLIKFGEGELSRCLVEAVRIDPPGGTISGFSDIPPTSAQRILRVNKHPFDKVIALELGEISVWTGLPGCGKSTLITWVADEVSRSEGIRVGNIGFETHTYRIRDQLSRNLTNRPWSELNADQQSMLVKELDERWRLVHPTDESENHLGWLENMVKVLALRDGCKLIIVDPWNELEHLPQPGENMTHYINFALKFIRKLAKRLEVHIAIVAHPKKINSQGKIPPPTGYDIADSAAFFNKPGLGITVHPEGTQDFRVHIINWKTRDALLYGTRKSRIEVDFAEVFGRYMAIDAQSPRDQQPEMEF